MNDLLRKYENEFKTAQEEHTAEINGMQGDGKEMY